MKLYLVRHGQTDWNIKKQVQGVTDIALNETGIKQAEALHQQILAQGIKFDLCYASPLQRARKTAEIIVDNSCPIIISELLKERCFGDLEQMAVEPHTMGVDFYDINLNTAAYNVEPILDLLARTKEFLEQVKADTSEDSVILVVAHGALLKALTANIIGYDEKTDFSALRYDNCEIREYNIQYIKIVSDG